MLDRQRDRIPYYAGSFREEKITRPLHSWKGRGGDKQSAPQVERGWTPGRGIYRKNVKALDDLRVEDAAELHAGAWVQCRFHLTIATCRGTQQGFHQRNDAAPRAGERNLPFAVKVRPPPN